MKIPILKGKRVVLRSLSPRDAANYVRWFADKEVVKYMALQTGISMAEENKYLKKLAKQNDHFNYAITIEDGRHIGGSGVSLFRKDERAEIGIIIGEKQEWNKGYGTEALKLIIDYIFNKLKFNRVELAVDMPNKRALTVYKKVGFKLEGVKRQQRKNIITGKFEDEGVMAILKKDWIKNN